ncbi:hypothetical protein [uncultured Shimia sp.]|uniref:hypothetical protein n=1 Tax=uncultured Shimia sp. TaxID=573152 RepID=UPI00261F6837|nr:hypothetical protein [uncultured Shimia sp.]
MKISLPFIALMFAGATSAAELSPFGVLGDWEIKVDPSNGNGCLMERKLSSGTRVQIGVVPDKEGAFFAAYNPSWTSIEEGQTGQLLFDFGDSRFQGEVVGVKKDDIPGGYAFFNNPNFVSEFGLRFDVTLKGENGTTETIDLTGSKVALDAVKACQDSQN